MKSKFMSGITKFLGFKNINKIEIEPTVIIDELIIIMNQKNNEFEFGGEARVIIQNYN